MKIFIGAITYIGIAGFFICLIIMYATNHGIPGMQQFDAEFKLLDMRFSYTATDVNHTFHKLGDGGRVAYRNYWILDFFFIACFLIVQVTLINHIAMADWIKTILIALPILRAVFDVIENSMLLHLISRYPIQNNQLATICSWNTSGKFIALYLWLIGIAVMLLYPIVRKS